MLAAIGPFDANDELLFYVMVEHAFSLICLSISRGESCFLAEPDWVSIFLNRPARSSTEKLYLDFLVILLPLPALALQMRRNRSAEVLHIAGQAHRVSEQLARLASSIARLLKDGSEAELHECRCSSSPAPKIHRSSNLDLLNLCMMHAMGGIMVNSLFITTLVGPQDTSMVQELKSQSLYYSRQIWMLHEHGQHLVNYPTALMLSYASADTACTADWIIDTINSLQKRNAETKSELWTGEQVQQWCLMAIGASKLMLL